MPEGGTCTWCEGRGIAHIGTVMEGRCGWCDGTGIQKPSFHGAGGPGNHRTVGPIRAWCGDCGEWCYARGGDMLCQCCQDEPASAPCPLCVAGYPEPHTKKDWLEFAKQYQDEHSS